MSSTVKEIINYTLEVLWAKMPLLLTFLLFHYISFKLPAKQFWQIIKGILLSFIGLTLFLYGVKLGFMDTGSIIGERLGIMKNSYILIIIGFILGFVVTIAEPAIQILVHEIERVSAGYINKKLFLYFISGGVAISVALSIIRIFTGLSLWYFLLPGYIIVLILMRYVSPLFIAMAFDSGGIVTGPMIVTFILSFNLGISKTITTSNPLLDCFGMIALISLVPIIAILILGLLYERNISKEVIKHEYK